ncbi:MAG: tRNA (adenosine(37)-N6)-threonylcarbamoyltransferase complex dimerization subunit type 1 TsaB [Pseudomonadota bacterium]
MILLCLSTAEQGSSLAVVDGDRLICEEYWDTKKTHSKRLVAMIDHMVKERSGLALSNIDAFVAAKGPGSFTGLRIGISVIKGLAHAMGKPEFGVSSLDGIAFRFVHSSVPVCVMMDAKRNEVYTAMYHFKRGHLVSKSREQVLNPQKAIALANGPAIFAGSGSKAYKNIIEQVAKHPVIAHPYLDSVSAMALIQSLSFNKNDLDHPENKLEPVYIRKSDAQLNTTIV